MECPTGTVTFVFTDIQGSTALWERLGEGFTAWLLEHNRILRDAMARHGGFEVKTEGDAFLVAFADPSRAVRFALEAQEALHARDWPDSTGEILVRVGVHTGEPVCIPDPTTGRMDYFGPPVNRAARLLSAAHGGQVLLSERSFRDAGEALAEAVTEDLGLHRLKGIEEPLRLYQALPRSLSDRRFPPPAALATRPTNLPPPTTSFIGRAREIEELSRLLADGPARLVTVTGPGGTGKTRLATRVGLEACDRFPGGVWLADLAPARSAADVAAAVLHAFGVTPGPREDPAAAVANLLGYRPPLLLILDNFEQVTEHADGTVGRWRRAAPDVRFLVTSRALLGLAGERAFELAPLPAPPPGGGVEGDLASFDAVRLFLDRAAEARPGLVLSPENAAAVRRICGELEGIPLAIELAAARVRVLEPTEIARRLDQKFELLRTRRRDVPPRHQALSDAIAWGFDLLTDAEREAYLQSCIFRGGFYLDAAEAVIDLGRIAGAPPVVDVVESLREKSFLFGRETPSGVRFGIYIPIREYGEERWQAADVRERIALARRHAEHFVACARRWMDAVETPEVAEALDRLEVEAENLYRVADWAAHPAANPRDRELGARALLALGEMLVFRGAPESLVPRLDRAVDGLGAAPALRVEVLLALSRAHLACGERERALAAVEQGVAEAAALGDAHLYGVALTQAADVGREKGELARAQDLLRESEEVRRQAGEPAGGSLLERRTITLLQQGDADGALRVASEAEALARAAGNRAALARILAVSGTLLKDAVRWDESLAAFVEAEAIERSLGSKRGIARLLASRGGLLARRGDLEGGLACIDEAHALAREIGDKRGVAVTVGMRGHVLKSLGKVEEAIDCYREAEAALRDIGDDWNLAAALFNRGMSLEQVRRPAEAVSCYAEAEAIARRIEDRAGLVSHLGAKGRALLDAGRPEEARAALREVTDLIRPDAKDRARLVIYEAALARAEAALGNAPEAARLAAEVESLASELVPDEAFGEELGLSLDAMRRAVRPPPSSPDGIQ